MKKSWQHRLSDKNFLNHSVTCFEDLRSFHTDKSISFEELPFEERDLLTEAIHEMKHNKPLRYEPMINGIPLSQLLDKGFIPTTEQVKQLPVHEYTVVLGPVGGMRSRRFIPRTKHKLRLVS